MFRSHGINIGGTYINVLTKKKVVVNYIDISNPKYKKVWFRSGTWVSLKKFKEMYN